MSKAKDGKVDIETPKNWLYYGDNLEIMRQLHPESVDLIYLDPPFKSNQDYNVLFAEQDGSRSAAQIRAFGDTWRWDQGAAQAFQDVVECGGRISQAMQAFHKFLGESDMLAYLSMMAPRLKELHRLLKPTGSIYLHCDPTASHYLKMLLDGVFGAQRFRTEIIWKRTSSHGNVSTCYGDVTDTILYYSKGPNLIWNQLYVPYTDKHIESFKYVDKDGRRYTTADLRNPGVRPNLTYEYKGYKPHPNGWAISKERMERYDRDGRLAFPASKDGRIRLKRYLDEQPGQKVQNLWDDIPPIHSHAQERLGYPTQKPEALLERIIQASSNEGDVVLDPFCGCGTAIATAQKLKRQWIGIDITHLAVGLIKHRLVTAYGTSIGETFTTIGEPQDLAGARQLAKEDTFQFQCWALGLVGARTADAKKGADRGIDGRLYFHDDKPGSTKQAIFSVKSGHVSVSHLRDLRGVVDREKASLGVLITLERPTQPMKAEAASGGFYETLHWGRFPRIQIITIEELLEGRTIQYPSTNANITIKASPQPEKETTQLVIPGIEEPRVRSRSRSQRTYRHVRQRG